jgi:hypothetical protein
MTMLTASTATATKVSASGSAVDGAKPVAALTEPVRRHGEQDAALSVIEEPGEVTDNPIVKHTVKAMTISAVLMKPESELT